MKEVPVLITKASGLKVPFSSDKLRHSLYRSGADEKIVNDIISKVQHRIYEGISTKKIYELAFGFLKKETRYSAAKYKLKRAIMELGPSGFPFEKYIGELLKYNGYSVKVGEKIRGHCVNHEIDVVAAKDGNNYLIECKFHHTSGIISDVKIPLYIHARYMDIQNNGNSGETFYQGWVVTNTRFSKDAVQYGLCSGLYLVGWDYPKKGSLRERVDKSGLYPVTCLTSLKNNEKRILLDNQIVLCQEIISSPEILLQAGIPEQRREIIVKEAETLCKGILSKRA